ncbi:disulfide bond formation protein B [Vibrio sp. D431a]|nr:disulfide bond formation protein B [Vibrio sp. D431a]
MLVVVTLFCSSIVILESLYATEQSLSCILEKLCFLCLAITYTLGIFGCDNKIGRGLIFAFWLFISGLGISTSLNHLEMQNIQSEIEVWSEIPPPLHWALSNVFSQEIYDKIPHFTRSKTVIFGYSITHINLLFFSTLASVGLLFNFVEIAAMTRRDGVWSDFITYSPSKHN